MSGGERDRPERERELRRAEALARFHDASGESPTADLEIAGEAGELLELDAILGGEEGAPERLSGHRIVGEIGRGGMGRVFLAQDEGLNRRVAVKTLLPRFAADASLRARFMHEARAMARLSHPNIVRIYSLGPANEAPHFVMEYLDGAPLTQAGAGLDFPRKAELFLKVVEAVAFLHGKGLLHRDLKPANILVGADLEPKLLDFGLALDLTGEWRRLSRLGEVAGTPEYLSPEQTRAGELTPASDIFTLGAILYELLTGQAAFRGEGLRELVERIQGADPALPRRLNPAIPRDLQNICLKCLEKDPAQRYGSAGALAADLRRFLAGEPALAEPPAYSRLIGGAVRRHLEDLDAWREDRVISDAEYDGLRRKYDGLIEREDAWILEARRLTLPQVTLYLGAAVLLTAAALFAVFPFPGWPGWAVVGAVAGGSLPALWMGLRTWRGGNFRVSIAFLLAFCLMAPVLLLVCFEQFGIFAAFSQGNRQLELFLRWNARQPPTNAQLWWALLLAMPAAGWLRGFTRAAVFSLPLSLLGALLAMVTLLRMGLLEWLDRDPGRFYFHLAPCAAVFLAAGLALEMRRKADDSRYFYPFAVVFTWAALTGIALFHEPYAQWLKAAAPWTRGQIEYLFLINAAAYFGLDHLCARIGTAQVRSVGKAFRFLAPGHVLMPLLLLGVNAASAGEARVFQWLLPGAAAAFVFLSIPRQMKNFFLSGLVFLAIGLYRLQEQYFRERAIWPLLLLAGGLGLMVAAANYAPLRLALRRLTRGQ